MALCNQDTKKTGNCNFVMCGCSLKSIQQRSKVQGSNFNKSTGRTEQAQITIINTEQPN